MSDQPTTDELLDVVRARFYQGSTHWHGCETDPRHRDCAILLLINRLAAQARTLETLRAENERLTRVGQSCGAMADQRTAQLLEAKTALAEARAEMDRLRQLVDACIRGPRSPVEPT